MPEPFVVAVTPIRSRAWILDEHARALGHQPIKRLFYFTGDNDDHTLDRLRALSFGMVRLPAWGDPEPPPVQADWISYEVFNTGSPHWHRSRPGEKYTGDDHLSLSRVYNRMIDRALALFPEATHLWLVDSDVLPEPGCLELLLAADKDVIAPVVQHSENAFNFMIGERDGEPHRQSEANALGWYRGDCDGPQDGAPFPATFVSCCVLYRREVLVKEVYRNVGDRYGLRPGEVVDIETAPRFAPHPRSHDFPMMASLRAAGIELWVHPRARAEHRMKEPSPLLLTV